MLNDKKKNLEDAVGLSPSKIIWQNHLVLMVKPKKLSRRLAEYLFMNINSKQRHGINHKANI